MPLRAGPRCSCAAGWEPACGSVPDLDLHVPELDVEVPKISSSRRRSRRRRVPLQELDAPGSPQGLLPGQDYLLVWKQNMDIPVPHGRGVGRGLLGLRPDPNSAASSAHLPDAADEVFTGLFRTFPRG